MARLTVLGTAFAIPDDGHDNTHFVLAGKERTLLIDCASNPVVRLKKAGVALDQVSDLLLTHFHPDHVSGVALLLMDMWLLGRRKPLIVHGLSPVIERTESMLDLYGWNEWPNFFPVMFQRLPGHEHSAAFSCSEYVVFTSPVQHFVPTIGIRIEFNKSGRIFSYSCDTEPCQSVVRLAKDADVLFHEANAACDDPQRVFPGHSSTSQAGDIARQAGVKSLYLIHYPSADGAQEELIGQAQHFFSGKVALAQDFMHIDF